MLLINVPLIQTRYTWTAIILVPTVPARVCLWKIVHSRWQSDEDETKTRQEWKLFSLLY